MKPLCSEEWRRKQEAGRVQMCSRGPEDSRTLQVQHHQSSLTVQIKVVLSYMTCSSAFSDQTFKFRVSHKVQHEESEERKSTVVILSELQVCFLSDSTQTLHFNIRTSQWGQWHLCPVRLGQVRTVKSFLDSETQVRQELQADSLFCTSSRSRGTLPARFGKKMPKCFLL